MIKFIVGLILTLFVYVIGKRISNTFISGYFTGVVVMTMIDIIQSL